MTSSAVLMICFILSSTLLYALFSKSHLCQHHHAFGLVEIDYLDLYLPYDIVNTHGSSIHPELPGSLDKANIDWCCHFPSDIVQHPIMQQPSTPWHD